MTTQFEVRLWQIIQYLAKDLAESLNLAEFNYQAEYADAKYIAPPLIQPQDLITEAEEFVDSNYDNSMQ